MAKIYGMSGKFSDEQTMTGYDGDEEQQRG